MTQAGCYQLILDRKLGEYVLPDGWVVIAAGNPASERGVHFAMPRPLRNRFCPSRTRSGLERLVQVGRGRGRATGDHRLSALQAGPFARGRHNFERQCLAHSPFLGDGFTCSLRRGAQAEHSFSNRRWRVRAHNARRDRGAGRIGELLPFCASSASCRRSTRSCSIPSRRRCRQNRPHRLPSRRRWAG